MSRQWWMDRMYYLSVYIGYGYNLQQGECCDLWEWFLRGKLSSWRLDIDWPIWPDESEYDEIVGYNVIELTWPPR